MSNLALFLARRAYNVQRTNAKSRSIAWEFTFDEWYETWINSGKWSMRGRGNGYMMCRIGDIGPYAPGNVYIAPGYRNSSDKKTSNLPLGVSETRWGTFRVALTVNGKQKHIGSFKTVDLARSAYLAAGGPE